MNRISSLMVLLFSAGAQSVFGSPEGLQIVSGDVSIATPQSSLTEITTGEKAILHWNTFSIGDNETVRFVMPSSHASVLNRVLSGHMSEILGNLEANGQVFLINPNGILVGQSAHINTASFIASSFDLFTKGVLLAFEGSAGSVINFGKISAWDGDVILIGHEVVNSGTIEAELGNIAIASGSEVYLKLEAGEKIAVRSVESKALQAQLKEEGNPFSWAISLEGTKDALARVEAGGKIFLSGDKVFINKNAEVEASALSVAIPQGVFDNQGSIKASDIVIASPFDANSTFHNPGKIEGDSIAVSFKACVNSGQMQASRVSIETTESYVETANGTLIADEIYVTAGPEGRFYTSGTHVSHGGKITLLGKDLFLVGAKIDASGEFGGGEVRIGGDFQGKNPDLLNASSLFVSASTEIRADATVSGNAGRIILWSDERTEFTGRVSASSMSGDGGFIEVSGKNQLAYGGYADVHGLNGKVGELLLDPKNVTIDPFNGTWGVYAFELTSPYVATNFFGYHVLTLDPGNVLITDINAVVAGNSTGAAYLFNGFTGELLSVLTGSNNGDGVGQQAVYLDFSNNFVIGSPNWSGGGAATWGDRNTGFPSSVVSSSNSIIGGGFQQSIQSLANGNFLVHRVSNSDFGAVALASGGDGTFVSSGMYGAMTSMNSFISNIFAGVGFTATILQGGQFVLWSEYTGAQEGSLTWSDGFSPLTGNVSGANSVVGLAGQLIGINTLVLPNGNYVSYSNAGNQATAFNATDGTFLATGAPGVGVGAINSTNSLIGTASYPITKTVFFLKNSNFVVIGNSSATLGSGTTGITGNPSAANSIVGAAMSNDFDNVKCESLTNDNFVLAFDAWNGGVGAATLASGTTGQFVATSMYGAISALNSLVGTAAPDSVGAQIQSPAVGFVNPLIISPSWQNVGAFTLMNGTTGTVGLVSSSNSIVGMAPGDLSEPSTITLNNGNFALLMPNWSTNKGAVTVMDGSSGQFLATLGGGFGAVTVSNSITGSNGDYIGSDGGVAVNGSNNFVFASSQWANGMAALTGAVSTIDGSTGYFAYTGMFESISASNSIIGAQALDRVGIYGVLALRSPSQNVIVFSPNWINGAASQAGAVTILNGLSGEFFMDGGGHGPCEQQQ